MNQALVGLLAFVPILADYDGKEIRIIGPAHCQRRERRGWPSCSKLYLGRQLIT